MTAHNVKRVRVKRECLSWHGYWKHRRFTWVVRNPQGRKVKQFHTWDEAMTMANRVASVLAVKTSNE
jgi:hypothetical protein